MKFNNIPPFLIELVKRFGSSTPYFFTVLKYLGITGAIIIKLPDLLQQCGIDVPVVIQPYKTILLVAGIVTAIVSQLTTKSSPAIANEAGQIIQPSSCGVDLPYTDKKELEKKPDPITPIPKP